MEQGQHLFAIEVAREAGDEDSAIGRELRVGIARLLEELVHAALFLLPSSRARRRPGAGVR